MRPVSSLSSLAFVFAIVGACGGSSAAAGYGELAGDRAPPLALPRRPFRPGRLEESFGEQAEQADGGPRHFIGPQMALDLLDKRLSLAGGPAFGIGPRSPTLSGRLSLAYED